MTEQLGDKDVAAEIERIVDAACDEARERISRSQSTMQTYAA